MQEQKYIDYAKGLAALIHKGCLWVASDNSNSVIGFSLETFEVKYLYLIDDTTTKQLFVKMIEYEDSIYLIPYNASTLWKIDTSTGILDKISIGLTDDEIQIQGKFGTASLWNKKITMYGSNVEGIVVWDISTSSYTRIDNDDSGRKIGYKFNHVIAQQGERCYLPIGEKKNIVEYDSDKAIVKYICVDAYETRCNSMTVYGDTLIMSVVPDSIIYYGLKNNETTIKKIGILPNDKNGLFRRVIKKDGKTVILPSEVGKLFYSVGGMGFKEVLLDDKTLNGMKEGFAKYEFDLVFDNCLYIQSRVDGEVYVIDLDTMAVTKRFFKLDNESVDRISVNFIRHSSEAVQEDEIRTINHFINAVG